METFGEYITPEKAIKLGDSRTLKELRELAKRKEVCEVCESRPAWKFAGVGMCFTCTTGEADASEDYELI